MLECLESKETEVFAEVSLYAFEQLEGSDDSCQQLGVNGVEKGTLEFRHCDITTRFGSRISAKTDKPTGLIHRRSHLSIS